MRCRRLLRPSIPPGSNFRRSLTRLGTAALLRIFGNSKDDAANDDSQNEKMLRHRYWPPGPPSSAEPPNRRLPSGSVTVLPLTWFEPFFAIYPSTVTTSPAFSE